MLSRRRSGNARHTHREEPYPNHNCFGKIPLIFAIILSKRKSVVNVVENQIVVDQPNGTVRIDLLCTE